MWNRRNEMVFTTKEGLGTAIALLNRLMEGSLNIDSQDRPEFTQQKLEKWKMPPCWFFEGQY